MLVLGIDTTAGTASVALLENDKLLCEYSVNSGNTHSRTLLPMIESVLKNTDKKVSDIDLYVLAAGPGSFTGVRIGAAAVKGLAFTEDKACVGVSVLSSMARGLESFCGIACPVINARRGQVYCAAFRCNGKDRPERLLEDTTMMAEELCELLSRYGGEDIYFIGDGAEVVMPFCEKLSVKGLPAVIGCQTAASVAAEGRDVYLEASDEEKKAFNNFELSPIYLKKPQAEREREERLAAEMNLQK